MSKVNDDGYAFPNVINHVDSCGNPMGTTIHNGLTLRQYIATAAMQGLCANKCISEQISLTELKAKDVSGLIAESSVSMADALIAELKKEAGK